MATSHDNIQKVMDQFYTLKVTSQQTDQQTYDKALTLLRKIEDDLTGILPLYQKNDKDYRLGNETYGYGEPADDLWNLHYISDRWKCAFRIAWMLGLINPDYR